MKVHVSNSAEGYMFSVTLTHVVTSTRVFKLTGLKDIAKEIVEKDFHAEEVFACLDKVYRNAHLPLQRQVFCLLLGNSKYTIGSTSIKLTVKNRRQYYFYLPVY